MKKNLSVIVKYKMVWVQLIDSRHQWPPTKTKVQSFQIRLPHLCQILNEKFEVDRNGKLISIIIVNRLIECSEIQLSLLVFSDE